MKKILSILSIMILVIILIGCVDNQIGLEGEICDEQSGGVKVCSDSLVCGEGTPDNEFEWTCMTLEKCQEVNNNVFDDNFCFVGI